LALAELAATAASGMTPPAGPSWRRGALPALTHDRDRHLSVGRGGFTLHAATRAGAPSAIPPSLTGTSRAMTTRSTPRAHATTVAMASTIAR
jgi:hypothetical protein